MLRARFNSSMTSSFELLRTRERLRVGARFLTLRPRIVLFGALGNFACTASSSAPPHQKLTLALALGGTVVAFFAEAAWLKRHPLTERWLLASLLLTLLVLASGVALSGGLVSPLLPLLFAPVVVGFAAFTRSTQSALLFAVAVAAIALNAWLPPLAAFPPLPQPAALYMLLISTLMSLALLAVGVIGLVEAHARIAAELERTRSDMLHEAKSRAQSVEHLGAQVAHEVKNPLTAVRGLVQLVQRKVEEPRDHERLNVAVRELDRALEVLHGYLSFAKPLADLSLAEIDARALLEDVAGVLEARAHEQRVVIEVQGQATVIADRQRMRDALLNLALNALAAMPDGGKLELRAESSSGRALLSVIDSGIGMSPELLAELGKPFTSEAAGGTGLGVLVAQSVARQHGGALRFESVPARGTTALLELPSCAMP
jgi:signal transduction histidine kinase